MFFDDLADSQDQLSQEYPKYDEIENDDVFATIQPRNLEPKTFEKPRIVEPQSQNPQSFVNYQTQILFGPTQPILQNILTQNSIISQETIQFTQTNEMDQCFLTQFSQFSNSIETEEVWPNLITQQEIIQEVKDQQELHDDIFSYDYGSQDIEMSQVEEPVKSESSLLDSSTLSQVIFSTQYSQTHKLYSQAPVIVNSALDDIPISILRVFESARRNSSDYAFVYTLAAQLCHRIYPMNSYINLKLSLLLSLASIGPDPSKTPIPIVAVGVSAGDASEIMNQVANIADRFVNALVDITGAAIKANNCVEAGPLLLAKGGVCYMGDWAMKRDNDSHQALRGDETLPLFIYNK